MESKGSHNKKEILISIILFVLILLGLWLVMKSFMMPLGCIEGNTGCERRVFINNVLLPYAVPPAVAITMAVIYFFMSRRKY